ncbi:MAG: CDP-diacylglycerol--serine O-phosphatidyltransferase [Treponema sp.]|jgi:CDP-diacylglycerol--serine O-phosphatidyltransferase|nr:CDP-diacylglycerol--serine O-phosphatidyltransferase [Treponema sp.]
MKRIKLRRFQLRKLQLRKVQLKKIKPKRVTIKKDELKKGIYIIPSLFTCGNMSFGVLSVFSSVSGHFIPAAWCLICALACDILDGRIARMTRTTSEFGMQLDSLSDLVSFGIAPAIMMYMLVLNRMGKIGVSIAILFVLCSALRLARFNVLAQSGEVHKHFTGLPTPASAGVIISFVMSYQLLGPEEYSLNFKTIPVLMTLMPTFFRVMPVVMIALSFLMVSNVPYLSFKRVRLSKVRTIELLALLIVIIILVVVYPQNIFFIIFSVYAASGLLLYVPQLIIKRRNNITQRQVDGAEEKGQEITGTDEL